MEKIYLLKGLDCPNCAAKIEIEVGGLNGVSFSSVNLMKQTLTIEVETSVAATIVKQIESIVHSHEPDVEVSEKTTVQFTKVYLLKGLDCPNCSAKIEKEVGELDGVSSSVVNLMKQTLTIDIDVSFILRESSEMNVERIDSLIEELSNRISYVLKSSDFIGVAELTKALAELVSARASFKE